MIVVGSMLISDVPAPDAPAQAIAAYLGNSDNHVRNIIGAYLWVIGALAFLWFLVRLRNDIRRAEGGTGFLSTLVFAAGVAFAAVWMVSAASFAAVPYVVELPHAPITDPDLVRLLPAMGRLLLLLGGGFAGLLVLLYVRCDLANGGLPEMARLAGNRGRDGLGLRRDLPHHLPVLDLGVHGLRDDAGPTQEDGRNRRLVL